VVALFASNVHRMRAIAAAARATGRKICLLGRSLHTHSEVARELGMIPELAGLVVPNDEVRLVPRDRLCVLATGTQGEPPAALSRIAAGTHPILSLDPGDTVVLSSRIIPGNEKTVFDMLDRLERLGCHVVHRKIDPGVHVSGHAAREEQRRYLQLCRPRTFVPVHGTFHHLRRHAELARECGVQQTVIVENGTVVSLTQGHLEVVDQVETGIVHIDRNRVVDPAQLRDRELIGELGHAIVSFTVDGRARYAGSLDVVQRGFLHPELEDSVLEEAVSYVEDDLRRAKEDDVEAMEDRARRALKRFFARRLEGRKPIVTAVALEVRVR
jgi:ribonuclease J